MMATDRTPFTNGVAWPFFVLVVVGCSWITLSLFTAVVSSVFGQVAEHMAQNVVDAATAVADTDTASVTPLVTPMASSDVDAEQTTPLSPQPRSKKPIAISAATFDIEANDGDDGDVGGGVLIRTRSPSKLKRTKSDGELALNPNVPGSPRATPPAYSYRHYA